MIIVMNTFIIPNAHYVTHVVLVSEVLKTFVQFVQKSA